MAGATLSRQTPTVGAGCLNWARPDLRGGRPERDVPTAIGGYTGVRVSRTIRRLQQWWPEADSSRKSIVSADLQDVVGVANTVDRAANLFSNTRA